MFGSSLPPVVYGWAHVSFTLFVFVCVYWYPTHIVLWYCSVSLGPVCPMLLVSLDCPFLIAPSVFSDLYLCSQLVSTIKMPGKIVKNVKTELFHDQNRKQ
jgi:hypothetical protein